MAVEMYCLHWKQYAQEQAAQLQKPSRIFSFSFIQAFIRKLACKFDFQV
jgi:hypothetical protein